MTHLRFALAQIDTCVGDLDGNADKIMHYAHLAAHEGAHVVIFPEMTLTGYPIEDLALRRTFRKAAWDKANWLATELEADGLGDLYVAVGTVGTVILGIVLFAEPATAVRLGCIALIVAGIAGLKMTA